MKLNHAILLSVSIAAVGTALKISVGPQAQVYFHAVVIGAFIGSYVDLSA